LMAESAASTVTPRIVVLPVHSTVAPRRRERLTLQAKNPPPSDTRSQRSATPPASTARRPTRAQAGLRGLSEQLYAEFPRERSTVADALWYADLTTGPDGQRVTVDERLAEIERRYGTAHVVTASVRLSRPELLASVDRTLQRTLAQPR